jgi:hypothetical protein
MQYNELKNIKVGEYVIFGEKELLHERFSKLCRAEQTSNPDLQGLVIVRRPLLLTPNRYAFVASKIYDFEENLCKIKNRLADCLAEDAPYLEILPPIDRYDACFLGDSDFGYDTAPLGDSDFSVKKKTSKISFRWSGTIESMTSNCPAPFTDGEDLIDERLDFDRKKWIDKLSALVLEYVTANHAMPPQELIDSVISGKLQITDDNVLSPIVVNGNMQIILPAYNELELRMTPLARSVYILFLCHPEGIVLKNIDSYRDQLRDIYLMVKPSANSHYADMYISELTYPGSDSLQQKLSLIKRSINRYLLRRNIASAYYITGKRGEAYKIAGITPDRITLPRALRPTNDSE